MPFGYHGCYLRIDVSTGTAEHVPLADAVLRQFIGGSGLGVRLLLDEGAAHDRSARARGSPRFCLQPAGRQPSDDLGEVCSGEQEPADRSASTTRLPAAALRLRARAAAATPSSSSDARLSFRCSLSTRRACAWNLRPEYRGATCRETEAGVESSPRRRLSGRIDRAGG